MKRKQYFLAAAIAACTLALSSTVHAAPEVNATTLLIIPPNAPAPTHMGSGVVKYDSLYYESSKDFGSGKTAVITAGTKVVVNGVSYLQHNSETDSYQIERSLYVPYNLVDNQVPLGENYSMLHLCTEDGKDLGWVVPEVFYGLEDCKVCPQN